METKLGSIIVVVSLLNKISFVSNVMVKVGTFHYLHRHPKLRSCADEALKENLYVGGRVQMLTGECEGLNRSWVFNQTVQSGYAYAKKVSVQESYFPPLHNKEIEWPIPGVLREGATVTAILQFPPDGSGYYGIAFYDNLDGFSGSGTGFIQLSSTPGLKKLSIWESIKSATQSHIDDEVCTPPQMTKEMKISFRAHTGSLEILADDHEICMFDTKVDLTTLRVIGISVSEAVILHGVEFIDA